MLRRPRRRRPVAHVAVGTRPGLIEARACRLVVMPEWQGAGIGAVREAWRTGENRYGLRVPTLFHTSHSGLAAALRRCAATRAGGRSAHSSMADTRAAAARASAAAPCAPARAAAAAATPDTAATSAPSRGSGISESVATPVRGLRDRARACALHP